MMIVYNIKKLNATNYPNWCLDLKYLLLEKGVCDIIVEFKLVSVRLIQWQALILYLLNWQQIYHYWAIYHNIKADYKKIIEDCADPVMADKKLQLNYCLGCRSHHMKLFTDQIESRI